MTTAAQYAVLAGQAAARTQSFVAMQRRIAAGHGRPTVHGRPVTDDWLALRYRLAMATHRRLVNASNVARVRPLVAALTESSQP
jgi:hypothetical protein